LTPTSHTDFVIGIDFDNTIANYDDLIGEVSRDRGLIPDDHRAGKTEVRRIVRNQPDGELEWRKVQAVVYGSRMHEAKLADGVGAFFRECRQRQAKSYVVSHKTRYSDYDPSQTNLRTASLEWMNDHRFFDRDGLALSREDVFFENTRLDKIERMKILRCTHFIDDLEEIFLETSFPTSVQKILYSPRGKTSSVSGIKSAATWNEISECIFAPAS